MLALYNYSITSKIPILPMDPPPAAPAAAVLPVASALADADQYFDTAPAQIHNHRIQVDPSGPVAAAACNPFQHLGTADSAPDVLPDMAGLFHHRAEAGVRIDVGLREETSDAEVPGFVHMRLDCMLLDHLEMDCQVRLVQGNRMLRLSAPVHSHTVEAVMAFRKAPLDWPA